MRTEDFHILIVDDEEDIQDIYYDAFEMEGFKVSTASCGKLALEIFYKENIDVIISDSLMPGMNGEELLQKIKESGKAAPYFYFSTGMIDKKDDYYTSSGATGIISKPFDVLKVVEKVKEMLTQAA